VQYVREVVDELAERRGLIELREGRDRARAVIKARVDVSAEGVKRSRYEAMSDRAHHAALRELRGLQEMRRKSGEVGTEGSDSQGHPEDRGAEASAPAQGEANPVAEPAQSEPIATSLDHQEDRGTEASAPAQSEANALEAPAQGEANAVPAPAQSEANATQVGGGSERRNEDAPGPGVDRGNSDVISDEEHEELGALYRAMIERVVSRL
jgi:hypothetical protein